MNLQQLLALAPVASADAKRFLVPLNGAMDKFSITTLSQRAAFLAQVLHESANLSAMSENFNYTPQALAATFNTPAHQRFTPATAALYGRSASRAANQCMIANTAYANRMGNGSIESGDGWRYRGRGPGQLTGKANYALCGAWLGLPLTACPDQVAQPDVGCLAFAWFWARGNPTGASLNLLADSGRYDAISRAVSGGTKGLAERLALTARALLVLA